jgi:adenosylcobyric acid synthase
MLYDLIKIPVVGVVPYMNVDIDDEDSLSDCLQNRSRVSGDSVDIAVIKLPRISDFTDFNALDAVKGLSIRYISSVRELGEPDMLVIPDTKSPMGDLLWMRSSGLEAAVKKLAASGKPVFAISGGMEMMGQSLEDPDNIERGGSLDGFGLLPHRTLYRKDEIQKSESGSLGEVGGLFKDLSGKKYAGYEQHHGIAVRANEDDSFSPEDKIINKGNVYGTYIHGVFDSREVAETVAGSLLKQAGCDPDELEVFDRDAYKEGEYDKLADYLSKALDMEYIYEIMGIK